nr:hypothetical protein [Tanacetum cinerariifolium]
MEDINKTRCGVLIRSGISGMKSSIAVGVLYLQQRGICENLISRGGDLVSSCKSRSSYKLSANSDHINTACVLSIN